MYCWNPGPFSGPGRILPSLAAACLLTSGLAATRATAAAPGAKAALRERVLLDAGWRFQLASEPSAIGGATVTGWRYRAVEDGAPKDAPPPGTTGADWEAAPDGADTFHDRVGFAWYRADLGTPSAPPQGARRVLYFSGVDDNATVYLNGKRLAHHEGWDESFDVPIPDDAWNTGGPNILFVLVENTAGAGLPVSASRARPAGL